MTKRREPRFWGPDVRKDVDDELAYHLEMREREYAARGLPPGEARDAAVRKFGDPARVAAACRDIDQRRYREERRASMWMDLRQDIGYALRLLGKAPGFAAIAVVTLALGIGAPAAIFSLANWTMLRPVSGVEAPEDVRVVWSGRWADQPGGPFSVSFVSNPNFADVTARLTTVSAMAGYQRGTLTTALAGRDPVALGAHYVSGSYFDLLGVRIPLGRPFIAGEHGPSAGESVLVISDRLWTTLFGRAGDVLQQTLHVNGLPFAIVGVAPPGFHGTERVSDVDLWLPGSAQALIQRRKVAADSRTSGGFYEFIVRRAPAATWDRVAAELQSFGPWLAEQHPVENAKFTQVTFHLLGPIGLPPHPGVEAELRGLLRLMLGASGLVLLIACANVAGLLLVRGLGRQGEMAVRKALGASRLRLVRQQVTEGAMLWMMGGATALLVIHLLSRALDVAPLIGLRVREADVPLDWRVVLFTAGLSLVVGLVFSALPAWRAVRARPADVLRAAAPTSTGRRLSAGTALTVVQMSISLALVVGALLLAGTVRHLTRVPLGFDPSGVVLIPVDPTRLGYALTEAVAYAREFERRLAAVPGVEAVAVAQGAPFRLVSYTTVRPQGAGDAHETLFNQILSPAYFDTLRIPLLRGRLFEAADISQPGGRSRPVVILSRSLAQQMFGDDDPLGRIVEFPVRGREKGTYEVVGIVGDVRHRDRELTGAVEPVLYEPAGMDGSFLPFNTVMARAPGRPDLAAEIQAIARALNPAMPVQQVTTIPALIDEARTPWTVLAWLLGTLAAIGCMLAAIGLYGVLASGVAERRREIGIRMALGASAGRVMALVLRRTVVLTTVGLGLGILGATWLVRVLESRLVGIEPFDRFTWLLAATFLTAVALAASAVPARRAMRVNLTETLKSQ
jgi:putative ABC transport system permease protein